MSQPQQEAHIQQQIGTERPSYGASDIAFLPRDPMPQFESLWGTALANGDTESAGRLTSLLARFGAGNATAQVGAYVESVLASPSNTCGGADPSAVAYLVRFDTEHARTVLARERERQGQRCGGIPFGLIARLGNGSALQEAALAALNDTQPDTAWDLVTYLGRYGTPAARKPLEDRLTRFFAEMPDQGEQLDAYGRSTEATALSQQVGFGQALMQAVLHPQGWTPTPQEQAALLAQCHVPPVCQASRVPDAMERLQLSVQGWGESEPVFNLSPFPGQTLDELKAKLSQLPAGTTITLLPSTPETAENHHKAAEAVEAAHLRLVSP